MGKIKSFHWARLIDIDKQQVLVCVDMNEEVKHPCINITFMPDDSSKITLSLIAQELFSSKDTLQNQFDETKKDFQKLVSGKKFKKFVQKRVREAIKHNN